MATALLILYGSLYPFDFVLPAPEQLSWFLAGGPWWTGRADVLGNVALFVPWGLCAWLASAAGLRRTLALSAATGAILALLAQLLQLFVPERDPRLSDVVWNLVGLAIGLALARALHPAVGQAPTQRQPAPDLIWLFGCWLVAWLPWVPTLDLGLLWAHLKRLAHPTWFSTPNLGTMAALALIAAYLAGRLRPQRPIRTAAAALALLAGGQFLIPGALLNVHGLFGVALGGALWWAWHRRPAADTGTLAALVLLMQTFSALAPLDFSLPPQAMQWLPFEAMLQGSMLSNAQALAREGWVWGAVLLLAQRAGGSVRGLSVALALWVLCLEGLQCLLPSRTPDVSPALIVLLLGQLLARHPAWAAPTPVQTRLAPAPPTRGPDKATGAGQRRSPWLSLLPVLAVAVGVHLALRLPGLPYNVVELFRGDAHPAALLLFAMALVWTGAGASWAGARLARMQHPGAGLAPVALAVALVSLVLLSAAVTTESLADIAGSNNLYFFVTERGLWGETWSGIFTLVGSPLVSTVERIARFAALYGPLPVLLGAALASRAIVTQRQRSAARVAELAVATVLLLWLCKAVAFDWSSTDNLNELIARDGPWGWGGGGYLYALLALLCGHGWALSRPLQLGRAATWWPWLLLPLSVALGWWLLNQGLEARVQKYDLTYSGVQFLLGPDRQRQLGTDELMLRWAALQLASLAVLASGLWAHGRLAGTRGQTSTSVTVG